MSREKGVTGRNSETYGNVTVFYEEGLLETQQARPEDAKILELVEAGYDCRRGTEDSWPVLYHLSHLRENQTEWLPIGPGDRVLEFGADTGELAGGEGRQQVGQELRPILFLREGGREGRREGGKA